MAGYGADLGGGAGAGRRRCRCRRGSRLYPAPLALAALYGLLTALAFALWPLGRAARISGAALFRDVVQPSGTLARRAAAGG